MRHRKGRVQLHGLVKRALGPLGLAGGARDEPLGQRAVVRRGLEPAPFGGERESAIELCPIGERARGVEVQDRFARAQQDGEVELGDRIGERTPRGQRASQILMRLEGKRKLARETTEGRFGIARVAELEARKGGVERLHVRFIARNLSFWILPVCLT